MKTTTTKQPNYSVRLYEDDGTKAELPQFHFRGIQVKYYGPTNYRGSRIKLYDTRHKKTIWLSYSYKYGDINAQAIDHLLKQGIESDGFTYDEKTGVYTILTTNFDRGLIGEYEYQKHQIRVIK